MGYRLVVNEEGQKRTYPLGAEVVSMGRASSNTIPLKDNGSSRHHCQVSLKNGHYFVQDLGSRNGTLLNKKPVTAQKLADGDVIQIGKTKIVFMQGEAEPVEEIELAPDPEPGPHTTKRQRQTTRRRPPADTKARTRKASREELGMLDPEGADSAGLTVDGEEEEDGLLPGLDEPHYLIWFTGADEQRFPIRESRTTIGRLESNTVGLPGDESVSGKHAELRYAEGLFTLRDLGSTNGTKVNGITITEHRVKPGDLIEFGRTQFAFRNESWEEAEELPSSGGMELPQFATTAGPYYPGGGGAPRFLLPFVGTLAAILLPVAGLTLYALRGSKLPPPPVPAVPGNLISDYSFELTSGDRPVGWKLGGAGIAVKQVSDAPSGKRVLAMTHDGEKEPLLEASFDRTIPVKPFLHYKVQAKVRHTKGKGYAGLRLQWLSSKDPYYRIEDHVGLRPAAAGWQELAGAYTAPAEADYARVACLVLGQAEGAEFDDVQMFEASKGAEMPPALETTLGNVAVDRAGLLAVTTRRDAEQVLAGGRLQVVDEEGRLLYDQALIKLSGKPRKESETLVLEGSLIHLRGGPPLALELKASRYDQGIKLDYRLRGAKIDGARVRFRCVVDELDAASAMAVETDGNFEMLRGEFVRPQVTLLTWKGKQRHLGLYPAKPAFLRYGKGAALLLDLFAPMADDHPLSFKLRLDFAEDQAAMGRAFKAAYAEKDAGRMGEAYRRFGEIIRSYPFIEGASKARDGVKRIEQEAAAELKKLQRSYERSRFFGRSALLLGVRGRLDRLSRRYDGMAIVAKARELDEQVKNALVDARARELEAEAGTLLQRADDFREAKMIGLAVTFYRRIVEQCPGTAQAKQAAQALKELGR